MLRDRTIAKKRERLRTFLGREHSSAVRLILLRPRPRASRPQFVDRRKWALDLATMPSLRPTATRPSSRSVGGDDTISAHLHVRGRVRGTRAISRLEPQRDAGDSPLRLVGPATCLRDSEEQSKKKGKRNVR
nr:PREDICTED: uncharacterized protein LOC108951888 [Musa acuminata subsp. malaccensis]